MFSNIVQYLKIIILIQDVFLDEGRAFIYHS